MHELFIDDDRIRQEQDRDMQATSYIAQQALARCVGVAMTEEEVDCILCLAGLKTTEAKHGTK